MKYRHISDGRIFPCLTAATNAYRFASLGTMEHHDLPTDRTEIIRLIGIEPVPGTEHWPEYDPDKSYIVVIRSRAVRDVQACTNADCEPADDDAWADCENAEIYLGMFHGETALEDAAAYGCTVPENIRLIDLESLSGNIDHANDRKDNT